MRHRSLRYLQRCGNNVEEALKMMVDTFEWRRSFFASPLKDSELLADLQTGVAYMGGRDAMLRPTLYCRVRCFAEFD